MKKPGIEHDMKASRSRCPIAAEPSPGPGRHPGPTDTLGEDPSCAASGTCSPCNASPIGLATQVETPVCVGTRGSILATLTPDPAPAPSPG